MANLKKQFKAVKDLLGTQRDLKLSNEDALSYQDVLLMLEERGYIHNFNVDGLKWYRVTSDLRGFETWLNEEVKEAKSITRREWIIGVVCAIIGATIGLIPYIVSLLGN